MTHRLWSLAFLPVVAALFTGCGSPGGESGRQQAIREVYGWVVSHSAVGDKPVVISPDVLDVELDDRCLAVPASDLAQMHADFERRKDRTVFPESLVTGVAYEVLDSTTAGTLRASLLLADSEVVRRRFPGATHILIFSKISFNDRQTMAVVHVDSWCGAICGRGDWFTLQRERGLWSSRPWVRCVEIP